MSKEGSSSSDDNEQHYQQSPKPQEPEEYDDESDDEENQSPQPQEPERIVKKLSLQQPQESNDDCDDDSSYDSDDFSVSAYTIKPILPKSVSKSPQSKPILEVQQPGEGEGCNRKRPAEIEVEEIDKVSKNKKSKVSNGDGQSEDKEGFGCKRDEEGPQGEEMRRVIKWSEEDQIVLLGGIIDYKAKTGDDVNSKIDAFYKYVKDFLSVGFTRSQVYEKIRRLKKKFRTNDEKCKNGEEPVFARPHETELFEISKKIWGSPNTEVESREKPEVESRGKPDGMVVVNKEDDINDKEETLDVSALYPLLFSSLESEACVYLTVRVGDIKEYVKKIIMEMGEEKAKELEDEWKAIFVMDHQVYARRRYLISKQADAVLDTL